MESCETHGEEQVSYKIVWKAAPTMVSRAEGVIEVSLGSAGADVLAGPEGARTGRRAAGGVE